MQLPVVAGHQLGVDRAEPHAELAPDNIGHRHHSRRLLGGLQHEVKPLVGALAAHPYGDRVSRGAIQQCSFKIERAQHALASRPDDDISRLQPGTGSRAGRLGALDKQPARQRAIGNRCRRAEADHFLLGRSFLSCGNFFRLRIAHAIAAN